MITDTNDAPLTSVQMVLAANTTSSVFVARIDCVAGMFLTAQSDAQAQVLARRTGSGDAFGDIAVSPISLTSYDGQTVDFDVKVQAGATSTLARVALPVRVTFTP